MNCANFNYTRQQLELLADCIYINDELSAALFVFFDTAKLEPTLPEMIEWLRKAEQIKADPNYIEKHLNSEVQRVSIELARN